MKKQHRVAPDVKEQILKRIKEEGVSVAQAAKEHGIAEGTIYGWIGKGVEKCPDHRKTASRPQAPERRTLGTRGRAHPQSSRPKKRIDQETEIHQGCPREAVGHLTGEPVLRIKADAQRLGIEEQD